MAQGAVWSALDALPADARVGSSNRTVYLHPDVVVTNNDVARSRVVFGISLIDNVLRSQDLTKC